jgi:hypothetical protein
MLEREVEIKAWEDKVREALPRVVGELLKSVTDVPEPPPRHSYWQLTQGRVVETGQTFPELAFDKEQHRATFGVSYLGRSDVARVVVTVDDDKGGFGLVVEGTDWSAIFEADQFIDGLLRQRLEFALSCVIGERPPVL